MFPEKFKNRLARQKHPDTGLLLEALSEPSPVSIRINPAKWSSKPRNSGKVPWCTQGWYMESRPSFTLDPLFHAGCYYPQEASGMFLEQVLKQTISKEDNIKVLDLCGAPGGKSTHLSSLIGDKGLLVANEVIRSRALILAENLTKWGLSNSIVTQSDPSAFNRIPGFFDLVLVDAPCSGEGMFRDQIAVREWSEENTSLCSDRQKRILMDVWPALKENGILVYSTCTFNPGENEENIKWLTGKHQAETVKLELSGYEGIKEIDYQGIHGYGFYPGKIRGEGFFIAALRKTGRQDKFNFRFKSGNNMKFSKEEKTIADEWTHFPSENLIMSGEDVLAPAGKYEDYLTLTKNLKIIKAGTKIFTVKKKNYLPAHELALTVKLKKQKFPVIDLDLKMALSYLHRDKVALNNIIKGWNIITYKGVNLGFINNIGSRVNNYYPVNWRIKMNIPEIFDQKILEWDYDDKK